MLFPERRKRRHLVKITALKRHHHPRWEEAGWRGDAAQCCFGVIHAKKCIRSEFQLPKSYANLSPGFAGTGGNRQFWEHQGVATLRWNASGKELSCPMRK